MYSLIMMTRYIRVYPSGAAAAEGKYLSMYLSLDEKQKFLPYEKIYVRAKLRVLNQRQFSNYEKQGKHIYTYIFIDRYGHTHADFFFFFFFWAVENWYNAPGYGAAGWGYHEFIPLSDLKDLSKGFIVNDVLKVQVQMDAISLTKYFPS